MRRRVVMGAQDRDTGVLKPEAIEFACAESMRGALAIALGACSVLELWLLVAMYRLKNWRKRPAATFLEAYGECVGATAGAAAQAVESYGRMCANHAWENLLNMELLRDTAPRAHTRSRRAGSQFHQVCVCLYVAVVIVLRSCGHLVAVVRWSLFC